LNPVVLDRARLVLGERVLLEEASLALEQGEFVALLGPNGAGKTSLLRALLGLIPLRSGRIEVLGRPPARGDRRIGYLPQSRAAVTPRLRARDLIAVAAPVAARAEVTEAIRMAGADGFADLPFAALSGGQRQRLLFAQALLGRPRLLLLDEPLQNLDPPSQRAIADLAARACRDLGATVLFSAHELTPLLDHVDRVLYLGHGHAAIGPAAEVVTPAVLSRLYGGPVEVVRAAGRVFVVAGDGLVPDGH
jgi:zinc/manganese transport system ATP-binding protein